jgi:hypothetical protein
MYALATASVLTNKADIDLRWAGLTYRVSACSISIGVPAREPVTGARSPALRGENAMLIVAVLLYFLPTVIALSRGHLSALAIFFLNLFLGWTLIGWIIALIWSCTGNTQANFYRLEVGPTGPIPQRRSGSLWLVLILVLVAILLLDKRRDFRDVRSFDFNFSNQTRL